MYNTLSCVLESAIIGLLACLLLLACVVFFSLARGLCSVSDKDVLGKTVSKSRRDRLMGYSASLAGIVTLAIGLLLQSDFKRPLDVSG